MSEAARLTLAQWLSPAFPVGGYAWSHGVEQAIVSGWVRDAGTLGDYLEDVLKHGAGRADAILLCAAMRPDADLRELTDLAQALCAGRERRDETLEQGTAFAAATGALTGMEPVAAPLPVAVGRAAAGLDLPPAAVGAQYLLAMVQGLVLAAVRFLPLGQTEGQRVVARLLPPIIDIAREAAQSSPDDIGSAVFAGDLAAMAHETLETRMFRS